MKKSWTVYEIYVAKPTLGINRNILLNSGRVILIFDFVIALYLCVINFILTFRL